MSNAATAMVEEALFECRYEGRFLYREDVSGQVLN